jgi:hypothetical protein
VALKFEDGLSVSGASLEWNVLGVGHEFWIAAQAGVIIGVTVLAREDAGNLNPSLGSGAFTEEGRRRVSTSQGRHRELPAVRSLCHPL